MVEENTAPSKPRLTLRRLAPLIVMLAGAVALYVFGGDYLSFEALREHRAALTAWRDAHYALVALAYVALYATATALSFPGGLALTLAGGFLFGAGFGAAFAVSGASIGAIIIFLIARTSLGEALQARAGPFMQKAEAGFHDNEVSWLLIMRLVPAVPFFVANIVPALLGASTFNYAWTTVVGIIPGGLVYAAMGAGLGEVFAAGATPDFGLIFKPHVLGPLLGLAALSALPMIIKLFRRRRRAG